MRKNLFAPVLKSINNFPENMIFLATGTLILLIPMIATICQFADTGYFQKAVPILLLYWPGSDYEIKIPVYVWLFMSLIFGSYLAGIFYMLQKRTLGKVILLTIGFFMISIIIRTILTSVFGLHENQLPDMKGKANSLILGQWHNPIWEEIVFRGIPLLLLILTERYITKRRTKTGVLLYFLIPAIFMGLYHIPEHGLIRFFDTLLICLGFSWLALRYSFFAAIVMHYIADAMIVLSLNKIPTIQPSEIPWIIQYGPTLNTVSSLLILFFIILIPVLIIYGCFRNRGHFDKLSDLT